MGGQACILYGAAEFSRDADFAVFASRENLERLEAALADLAAEVVAVPPFELRYLERGHAVHFRCRRPDVERVRLDVMTTQRGVAPFPALWERRTTHELPDGLHVDVMGLPDLVASKKTQRDKDWPMIRRLLEAHYDGFYDAPTDPRIAFWLAELRTPELLVECAGRFGGAARGAAPGRPAIEPALAGDEARVGEHFAEEQRLEMQADREYWAPLRAELEQLRHRRRRAT